jgi:hypothetical protein
LIEPALSLEELTVLTERIDPTRSVETGLLATSILKWWDAKADSSCRAASTGFEMTMVIVVLDAPAVVSDPISAMGTAAMPTVITANAEPTRKLGF